MATKNFYDAVLLGTELPTLLAGGLLAKRGFRVLLVGQSSPSASYQVDGLSLPRRPFTLPGHDSPAISRIFTELALRPLLKRRIRPLSPALQAVLPNHRLDLAQQPELISQEVEREFPSVRRAADDFLRASQRSWERINRLLERDLVWPPGGFFERREFSRAAMHHPFGKDGVGPTPLSELPDDHPFRLMAGWALRFMDGTTLGTTNSERELRQFAALLHSAAMVDGGCAELRDVLIENLRTHNGDVRFAERVEQVVVQRSAVVGVRLSLSEEEMGCHFVLSGIPIARLCPLLSERRELDAMLEEVGKPEPRYLRYSLNAVVDRAALPEAMGRNVLLLSDPRCPHGEGALWVETDACSDSDRAVVTAEALVPALPTGELLHYLSDMRERVYANLLSLMPFIEGRTQLVDSPHDGRPVQHPREDRESDPPEAWSRGPTTMPIVYTYPRRGVHGCTALPARTPVKRLLLCNEQVVPGLGYEGAFLAAWSAARIVTKALEREWMNRGRWTKVEL